MAKIGVATTTSLKYPHVVITFVEDPRFTAAAGRLLGEDELFALMQALAARPEAGTVIPGSGGCRKLRWAAKGRGTRGGSRVIYFFRNHAGQILLLELYAKNEKADLSAADLKLLRQKVKS
jgi:hypothetical protein